MANLSTLTPHSSLVFEDDNSTDSENGCTSDELDVEKKENKDKDALEDSQEQDNGATCSSLSRKNFRNSTFPKKYVHTYDKREI